MSTQVLSDITTMTLLAHFIPKVFAATLCGILVGVERSMRNRTAGIKTNVVICVGSTLFTTTTVLLSSLNDVSDVNRGIAQIISGIGFLGAGAIIKTKKDISGLTTASLIWLMGAIGVIIGAGWLLLAIIITVGFVLLTMTLGWFEKKFIYERRK